MRNVMFALAIVAMTTTTASPQSSGPANAFFGGLGAYPTGGSYQSCRRKLLVRKQRFVEAIDRSTATSVRVTRYVRRSANRLGRQAASQMLGPATRNGPGLTLWGLLTGASQQIAP
jgi:hypothetical protein